MNLKFLTGLNFVKKHVRIEEWLSLAVFCVATAIDVFVYGGGSWKGTMLGMVKYFSLGTPFFFVFALVIYPLFFAGAFRTFANSVLKVFLDRTEVFSRRIFVRLCSDLVPPFRLLAPAALVSASMYGLLARLDIALQYRVQDFVLYYADTFLLGVNPFLWLPTLFPGDSFVFLVHNAYTALDIFMGVGLLILFFKAQKLFRVGIITFITLLILAYPIYYVLPCQDPGNEFIFNIRGNKLPSDMQKELLAYHPSPRTKLIIEKFHEAELNESNNTVPISCFPSMHASWALMLVFLLARWKLWSLVFTVPYVLFMLAGGLYFAQHYFIDYVAAVPLLMLSLSIAFWLFRIDEKRKAGSTNASRS